jgi:hypothetical protein
MGNERRHDHVAGGESTEDLLPSQYAILHR